MIQRKFIPGSQWLYFKIYTGVKTADEVLAHTIRPFLRELYAERWIDGSFFIRYNDPDFHIRLRLHIDRFENYAPIFRRFEALFQPLVENGAVIRVLCDTYEMAANIAQFPLPVIAGIGHERDETIVDRVAHMRVKTPTAAAAFLIGTFREQDGQLETWKNDFIVGVQELLHNEQNRQVVRISDFKRSVQVVLTGNRTNLKLLSQRLDHASENYIRNRQVYFDRLKMKITGRIDVLADRQRNRLENFGKALQQQTGRIFADQHRRLELAATTIKYVDPKNVLERGYSITRLNGKAVRKAAVLQAGEIVETELAHGKIQCQILNNSATQQLSNSATQ